MVFYTGRPVFCQPAMSGCKYFPISILCDEILKIRNFSGFWPSSLTSLLFFCRVYQILPSMPREAVPILQKSWISVRVENSCKEIELGQLSELLTAEDYTAPSEVFNSFFLFTFPSISTSDLNTKLLLLWLHTIFPNDSAQFLKSKCSYLVHL